MAKFLVVVETEHPDQIEQLLKSSMNGLPPPIGVKQESARVWTMELPKCSAFFATLLYTIHGYGRTVVVAQLAEGVDPKVSSKDNP